MLASITTLTMNVFIVGDLLITKQEAKRIRCLPRNLGIVGSNLTWVTTTILHMTPVLVGYRKRTRECFK